MKEFLFSFLINKCYKESENLFYLNDNVDIYIEIQFDSLISSKNINY